MRQSGGRTLGAQLTEHRPFSFIGTNRHTQTRTHENILNSSVSFRYKVSWRRKWERFVFYYRYRLFQLQLRVSYAASSERALPRLGSGTAEAAYDKWSAQLLAGRSALTEGLSRDRGYRTKGSILGAIFPSR
jgi:hypothetical protein